jgi:NTP pyrophosphatase (non-canonical NTP hydrolase)
MEHTYTDEEQLIQNASAYMRMKLAANREKGHWLEKTEEALVDGLAEEWNELSQALMTYKLSPTSRQLEEVRQEAADVHNYLEMLCAKLMDQRLRTEQSHAQAP